METPFEREVHARLTDTAKNHRMRLAADNFMLESTPPKYSYNFFWLGRPIIQYPQDMVAVQEIIWKTRPDLIIETGIAHGGSLVLSASMLAMLDHDDAVQRGELIDPTRPKRKVIGIDVDIREHNRVAIESHFLSSRIEMLEGSSIDPVIIDQVRKRSTDKRVMVMLDSNHTHDHVLNELNLYSPLVSPGCYCVVFDTVIAQMPEGTYPDRDWNDLQNPLSAVNEFITGNKDFSIDTLIDEKLQISVARNGYLYRSE